MPNVNIHLPQMVGWLMDVCIRLLGGGSGDPRSDMDCDITLVCVVGVWVRHVCACLGGGWMYSCIKLLLVNHPPPLPTRNPLRLIHDLVLFDTNLY